MSNAFEIGSRCGDFFYSIGSVSTTKAWKKPDRRNINLLIDDIKKIKTYDNYQLFLVGGVVNGRLGITNDIDIVINGESNPQKLEAFLHDLYDLALNKHRLLVDVKWLDGKPSNNQKKIVYTAIHFGSCKKKVGDKISGMDFFGRFQKLGNHLVVRKMEFPNEKSKNLHYINFIEI